jgi:hypothetical protein
MAPCLIPFGPAAVDLHPRVPSPYFLPVITVTSGIGKVGSGSPMSGNCMAGS